MTWPFLVTAHASLRVTYMSGGGHHVEPREADMDARSSRLIPDRIGLTLSLVLFGVPALVLWLATAVVLPALVARGWEPLSAWFLAGMLALGPLLAAALAGAWTALPDASFPAILRHLRVQRLSAKDWRAAGLALAVTIPAMGALQLFNALVWPRLPPHPTFITVQALEPGRYYLFALWLPFFAVNIVGEELWWRGFVQPRQEPVFGAGTWAVQGLLHGAFHFSFGPGVMFILWPVLFSIPCAVQRTRNTSVGMLIHAGVNGPAFLAVTLGLFPA
ncbi:MULTISPECIES: CPBP family intramembrane glutamic endopeptidase [Rhodomicrobium]|uniref:CPBP family intramembrane glutamic endopeptidase n=1 Tax=Rhodomicrobium TaxID=1068 RepID=UPI000B4C0B5A|nr:MULTISPECIES: CPBP family intramembrane glutamic endopeptidase [Rhodomicrobium]